MPARLATPSTRPPRHPNSPNSSTAASSTTSRRSLPAIRARGVSVVMARKVQTCLFFVNDRGTAATAGALAEVAKAGWSSATGDSGADAMRERRVLHALVDLGAGLLGQDGVDVEDDLPDGAGERERRAVGVDAVDGQAVVAADVHARVAGEPERHGVVHPPAARR